VRVQINCAYIIPPNRDMAFLNGALQLLEPVEPRGHRLPIDFLFRSMAIDQHERAIAIVLSGTGSDGTLGVRAIKGEGGMAMEEALDSLKAMVAEGLSAVEISAGQGAAAVRTARPEDEERPFFRKESAAAKRAVDIPVIVVGGIRSLTMAEDIVASGDADMISMARPFIREPNLIARWQRGDTAPATCISSNKCMAVAYQAGVLACQEEPLLRPQAAAG